MRCRQLEEAVRHRGCQLGPGPRETGSWSLEGGHNWGFPDEGTDEQRHRARKPGSSE